jgi:hypothetical protein
MAEDVLMTGIDEVKLAFERPGQEIFKDSMAERSRTRTGAGQRDRPRSE